MDERAREAKRLDIALRTMLDFPECRRWFWAFLAQTGVFHNAFALDPYATAFQCGKQDIGKQLLADITRVAPEQYLQMMRESQEDEQRKSNPGSRPAADTGSDSEPDSYTGPGASQGA